jgi:peroxiredoxin Q/BCP
MNLPATAGSGLDRFDIALFAASCDSAATNRYGVVHEGRAYPERWTFIIGLDGKILDVMTDVDAGAHGTQLAARLEELGVGRR